MTAADGLAWTLTDLALRLVCPRCGAEPGEPCHTLAGHPCGYLHGPRRSPIDVAYATGYTEGHCDAVRQARSMRGKLRPA